MADSGARTQRTCRLGVLGQRLDQLLDEGDQTEDLDCRQDSDVAQAFAHRLEALFGEDRLVADQPRAESLELWRIASELIGSAQQGVASGTADLVRVAEGRAHLDRGPAGFASPLSSGRRRGLLRRLRLEVQYGSAWRFCHRPSWH